MAKTKEEIALRNKLWRERRISNMTPEQKEAALAKERANYLRRNDNEKAKVATRKRDSKMTPEQRAVKVAANNTRNRNHRSNIKGTQEALWDLQMWYSQISATRQYCKKKNLPFTITAKYMASITPAVCPVLGIPLMRGNGVAGPESPSMDRLVSELGYVPGNIIVVSKLANQIRSNASPDDIIKVGEFYKKLLS